MNFIKFMTSNAGRAARVVLGLVIISLGMFVVQGTVGTSCPLWDWFPSRAAYSTSA